MHNQNIKQINKNLFKNIRLMRWLVLLIISFLLLVSAEGINAEQDFNYIDLRNWTSLGDSATWVIEPGGRTVEQTANSSRPTFYLSNQDYLNVAVRGTIEVNDGDNDFIGFVLGFQDNINVYDFHMIEWGLNNRPSDDDMILGFFDGVNDGFAISNSHEAYTTYNTGDKFTEYDRKQSGWVNATEYDFEILYTETQIRVLIDGVIFVESSTTLDNPYELGQFGFYGNSQPDVTYGNVRVVDVDTSSNAPIANSDTYGVSSGSSITINAANGLFFNDYDPNLDSFKINEFTQPTQGTLSLNVNDGSFTFTPSPGALGLDTFTYQLVEKGTSELLTSSSVTVSINIIDGENVAPTDINVARKENFTTFENGTTLATIAAVDANDGDFHDYLLIDNNNGRFGISTNRITLANKDAITYGETYNVTVRAVDFGGESIDKMLSIKLPYQINYELNGGATESPNAPVYGLNDNQVFIINPTKDDAIFDGWRLITESESYLTPAGLISIQPGQNNSMSATIHNYTLKFGNTSWTNAQSICVTENGYLATVTHEFEWNYILQKILNDSDPNNRFWLGAQATNKNDSSLSATAQDWQWVNNEGAVNLTDADGFHNWASGEPNNYGSGEEYLTTWNNQSWNDLPNDPNGMQGYMCEKDQTIEFTGNITLQAVYLSSNYTLSFETNGGSPVNSLFLIENDAITLVTPSRLGYTFEGWYDDSSLSQPFTLTTMPALDVTVHAKWEAIDYTLSFEPNNGLTLSSITQGFESSLTLPTPERLGYTFDGWALDGTLVNYTAMPFDNQTLSALWTPIDYTLTFNSNGGTAIDSYTGAFESALTLPNPTRTGYTFRGWFESGARVQYTSVPLGDKTLDARWTPNTYTLTMTNTANDETDTITAAYGSPIVVPIYRLDGYTFRGWFEGGTNVNFSSMPLGDRTIRAIMEPNPYTITFNTGEAPAIPALEAPYQSSIQLPTPTLENHTFDGWMLNGAIVNLTEMPLNGATLTASFTKLESTITFINPEGNAPAPITTLIGDAITLPTASKTGHTFDGWFLDGSQVSLTTMPELPITLTAGFTINQYTLNVNGFNGQRINQITADYGESVTLPIPEQLGYLFAGWTLNGQAFSGNQVSMPAGGGTVNALFDPILYPVSWVYKDEIIQMRLPFESAIPLPASNITGYAFEGWQENGTFIDSITVPLRGTTLTAIYRAYQTSQTFYLPGQTAQVTLTTDETFNGPTLNVPSHLVFGGYFTEPFGLGEALSPGDLIENGLDARSYPHVYNPASTYQVPSGETLFTGTIRSSSNITEPFMASRTSEIPWLSMVIWGSGILTLVILSERGRRRG